MLRARTSRELTIVAEDPAVRIGDEVVLARVPVPYEPLARGPQGHRVMVVDYDTTHGQYRPGWRPKRGRPDAALRARGKPRAISALLKDPAFHQQNVYAVVTRLLARFEFALGRRVPWHFDTHQLHVLPHGFAGANAYYARDARALLFGYFTGDDGTPIYTCLSHDIVAHETAHALLDSLRERYILPSSADQQAFHEGFADTVALLSVFDVPEMVEKLLSTVPRKSPKLISKRSLTADKLAHSVLLKLAQQFASRGARFNGEALRSAVLNKPSRTMTREEVEPYRRSEILSGAILNAFLDIWMRRMGEWLRQVGPMAPVARAAEDGVKAAEHLLTIVIRALDYCPATDIRFEDYLSALLTADYEVMPDDGKYKYRQALTRSFHAWGIDPAGTRSAGPHDVGLWAQPDCSKLSYEGLHLQSMQSSADEIFRFIWLNRKELEIYPEAFTDVLTVNPVTRVTSDGFTVRETVATYHQMLRTTAGQLGTIRPPKQRAGQPTPVQVAAPSDMPPQTEVVLYGGGSLIFDEFGQLKYHVGNRINSGRRQNARLRFLWDNRICDRKGRYGVWDYQQYGQRFALMNLERHGMRSRREGWQ